MWRLIVAAMMMAGAMAPAVAAERLQVPQLAGWKVIANVADRAGEVTELIPEAELADTWSRRVTIQAFRGVAMTVRVFLDQVVEKTVAVCDAAAAGQPSLGTVAGAEAGSRTVACGRYKGDGKGSYTLYYVIRGSEAFYVVSRSWRGQPFPAGSTPVSPDELTGWAAYVDALDLCDTKDPRRPCR